MRRVDGIRYLTWYPSSAIALRSQYLPKHRDVKLRIVRGEVVYHLTWRPREGYAVHGWGLVGTPVALHSRLTTPHDEDPRMKRRTPPAAGLPALPLDDTSKVLLKFPLVREFLSATAYEDQTPRQPGYMTIRNRVGSYEITVYDPDAGLRCAARAMTLDDVLAATELLLGAKEAPWEVDRFLMEQVTKNKKKRA